MCLNLITALTDLLDLTDKASNEWTLSDKESETEEMNCHQQGKALHAVKIC